MKPPKVVRYEGESKFRIDGMHEPPTGPDGKTKKVEERRDMTPREQMAHARAQWSKRNAARKTPSLLGGRS